MSPAGRSSAREVVHRPNQDQSDCDKLLGFVRELGHRRVTLIGAEGRRVDHMLGTLQSAARCGCAVTIACDAQMVRILTGPCKGSLAHDGLVSLLPLTKCFGVTLQGVGWPLDFHSLDALGLTSLSNRALGRVEYSIEAGAAALFWDYDGGPVWFDDVLN